MLFRHHIGQSKFMLASKGSQNAELVRTTSIMLVLLSAGVHSERLAWRGNVTPWLVTT